MWFERGTKSCCAHLSITALYNRAISILPNTPENYEKLAELKFSVGDCYEMAPIKDFKAALACYEEEVKIRQQMAVSGVNEINIFKTKIEICVIKTRLSGEQILPTYGIGPTINDADFSPFYDLREEINILTDTKTKTGLLCQLNKRWTDMANLLHKSSERQAFNDKDLLSDEALSAQTSENEASEEESGRLTPNYDILNASIVFNDISDCSSEEEPEEGERRQGTTFRGTSRSSASTSTSKRTPAPNHPNKPTRKKPTQIVNAEGETKLHVAIKNKQLARVKQLISENHDLETPDHSGWRPLHEAVAIDPPSNTQIKIVKHLVDVGKAKVNAKSTGRFWIEV